MILDIGEVTIGIISGKTIRVLKQFESHIMRKHRQGGQSAQRFQRLREISINEYFKKANQQIIEHLFIHEIEYIILAGSGMTKDDYFNSNAITKSVSEKIRLNVNISYNGEAGIREALFKLRDQISDLEIIQENREIESLFQVANEKPRMFEYGYSEVKLRITESRADKVYVSESFNELESLNKLCSEYNSQMIIFSEKTEAGDSLLKTYGDVSAILRF